MRSSPLAVCGSRSVPVGADHDGDHMAETYSHASLAVAASFAWCMADFMAKLGVEPTPRRRRHLQYRLSKLGIDTDHWDRSPRRWYSDDLLAGAVKESVSMAGVLRVLGVPNTGGQHAHLSRRIRRAGIDTAHFLSQAHQRGKRGPRRSPTDVLVVLPPGSARPRRTTLLNALETLGVPYECGVCDLGPTGARTYDSSARTATPRHPVGAAVPVAARPRIDMTERAWRNW